MRLTASAHTSRPWRIHDIAHDFDLVDVWALPTPGGPDDFPKLLELVTTLDPLHSNSLVVRTLFGVRAQLGRVFGWDDEATGFGGRVESLMGRVPRDLQEEAMPPTFESLPAGPLYVTSDEFAAEVANKTTHGVLHLGWVQDENGAYRGQLAVLVKMNGTLGTAYLTAITPFRHLIVYPALTRQLGAAWPEFLRASA